LAAWSPAAGIHQKAIPGDRNSQPLPIETTRPPPQIFPYHLAEYVCRVQRATPFKYYRDVLFLTLKEERSYDTIPNFTVRGSPRKVFHGGVLNLAAPIVTCASSQSTDYSTN
jgi:hypothetical protein